MREFGLFKPINRSNSTNFAQFLPSGDDDGKMVVDEASHVLYINLLPESVYF